jgi:1-acyl-sn-glycerol-3-phosphate acyltransferase
MSLLRTTLNESRLLSVARGAWRATRSAVFVLVYLAYLVLFMGFVQRFILIPLAWVFPVQSARFLVPWSRFQAAAPLVLLRIIAGVRISIEGTIGPENRVVIMNHQSVLDALIAYRVNKGYLMLIPTRSRYAYGLPGVSPFIRMAGFPLISQTRQSLKADLQAIADAADRCRRGEASFFIFPEGHRSKDGSILPFMIRGLRIVLTHAPLPVYCIVGDGMWHIRTIADTFTKVAGTRIRVRIIGPFQPPAEESEIPDFVASLRDRMIETLDDMRAGRPYLNAI